MRWISQVWMLWVCVGFLPPVYGANQKAPVAKAPVANPVAKTPGVHTKTQGPGKRHIGHHTTKSKGQSGRNMQQDHHALASSARSGSSSRVGVPAASSQALEKKEGSKVKSGQHAPLAAPSSPSKSQAVHISEETTKAQERSVSNKTTASLPEERASLQSARQKIQEVKPMLIRAHDDTLKRQKTLQAMKTTKPHIAQDVSNALKETEDIRRVLREDIDALDKLDKALQKDIQSAD